MSRIQIISRQPVKQATKKQVSQSAGGDTGGGKAGGGKAKGVRPILAPIAQTRKHSGPRPMNKRPTLGLYPQVSRKWLAAQMGTNIVVVIRWLRGKKGVPHKANLIRLAQLLEVEPGLLRRQIEAEVEKRQLEAAAKHSRNEALASQDAPIHPKR